MEKLAETTERHGCISAREHVLLECIFLRIVPTRPTLVIKFGWGTGDAFVARVNMSDSDANTIRKMIQCAALACPGLTTT